MNELVLKVFKTNLEYNFAFSCNIKQLPHDTSIPVLHVYAKETKIHYAQRLHIKYH